MQTDSSEHFSEKENFANANQFLFQTFSLDPCKVFSFFFADAAREKSFNSEHLIVNKFFV